MRQNVEIQKVGVTGPAPRRSRQRRQVPASACAKEKPSRRGRNARGQSTAASGSSARSHALRHAESRRRPVAAASRARER